jgi:tRNA nucleotidyltransferase (CCA-adding enzyme)
MFKIPKNALFVIDRLTKNGYKAYIVGGCVRDILLEKAPHDFDITTSAKPEEIISLFEKTIPTGIKHGTVTVLIENEPIEVTTFRTEGVYTDNRRPDSVEFVTDLREDLSRRDFTVNAMAYNEDEGVIDYFGGKEDLKAKILKAVGDPEKRFTEDALRILRLFRFASTLNFEIHENTFTAALKCAHLLKTVSRERIFEELKKAVLGDNFKVFAPLIECGALKFLNITNLPDFDKIKALKKHPLLCLYLSFGTKALIELKPSNEQKEYFKTLDALSAMPPPQTHADIKEMLNIAGNEILNDFFILNSLNQNDLKSVISSGEPYSVSHLKINGNDLINMGYKGEEIGKILEHLRKVAIINPQKNTKENLLKEIP